MLVNILVEDGNLKRVSWQPVMINQQSQPRCLRQSDSDFKEVVDYMKKITKAQKMSTDYAVEGDEIVMVQ